jgi:hypothetical protein
MPDHNDKKSNSGCLVLFLLAIPLLDAFGILLSMAEPYSQVLLMLGIGGFACGAALGACISVKIKQQPWWSDCRWAIYGLVGMFLPVAILSAVLFGWR